MSVSSCCYGAIHDQQALVLVMLLLAQSALAVLSPPYVVSATASGDFDKQNRMFAFNASNVNQQFANVEFPYYEEALCTSYDGVHQRIFFLMEGPLVIYSALTLEVLMTMQVSCHSF